MAMAWNHCEPGKKLQEWLNSPAENGLTVRQALAKNAPPKEEKDETYYFSGYRAGWNDALEEIKGTLELRKLK